MTPSASRRYVIERSIRHTWSRLKKGRRVLAVIFDLDGTIFHLPVDWSGVRKELAPAMGRSLDGVSVFHAISEATEPGSKTRARLFKIIDGWESPAADSSEPIEGATALLEFVSARFRTGLVTMQGLAACRKVLTKAGQLARFQVILTREDSISRAEQLERALEALGASAESSLFVGDKKDDLDSGRLVGVKVALVGPRARERWRPDFLCRGLPELQRHVAGLVGRPVPDR